MIAVIERTPDGKTSLIEDVRIDHGSSHVLVSEEFLDCTDVVAVFQQVGGEGMAEKYGSCRF